MKKTYTVLGKKVPVKLVDEISGVETKENETVWGLYNPAKNEIMLLNSLSKTQLKATLAHELGHVLLHRVGLDQVLSHELQEIIVESYAQFISENF